MIITVAHIWYGTSQCCCWVGDRDNGMVREYRLNVQNYKLPHEYYWGSHEPLSRDRDQRENSASCNRSDFYLIWQKTPQTQPQLLKVV